LIADKPELERIFLADFACRVFQQYPSEGEDRRPPITAPPIAQIRKFKSELVAEVDRLLDRHCDREIADILNQRGNVLVCS
jgi:hypothetical protein